MSADFRDEPQQIVEAREPLSEEQLITTLTNEFDSMFTREKLEANPYLVFKMNSNLEIPVTAMYKDRKVASVCTNLAIIREALSRSSSIVYDKEKGIVTPKLSAKKNKLVLNRIPDSDKDKIFKVIYQSPEYIQKISDKYIENLRTYTIILRTEEQAQSLVQKIKAVIPSDCQIDMNLETEALYLDILQKAQENARNPSFAPEAGIPYDAYMQGYGYYYGMNQAYMGQMRGYGYRGSNSHSQYNGYGNQMFIRRAQDEKFEAEPEKEDYNGHYKKKDRYAKRTPYQKHEKREAKHNKPQMSPEEIKRRTHVDSENFPPLVIQEAKPVVEKQEEVVAEPEVQGKFKITQDELIKVFRQVEGDLKANKILSKFADKVPVLNLEAKPALEFAKKH